ncbi:MAG TPA: hypothetical protein VN896_12750 [Methylomirabilota bacterium]|nr:hypothetical protein [Methylomirabilota bacterium]
MEIPRPLHAISALLVPVHKRLVPAITVTSLLCIAASAPPSVAPLPGPGPFPDFKSPCTDFASAVAGDSAVQIPNTGAGIEQALPALTSVVACSLRTGNGFMPGPMMVLRAWDPATLAPDSQTVALRRAFIFPDVIVMGRAMDAGLRLPMFTFVPPVVTRSVPGVAEPPRPQMALQLVNQKLTFVPEWKLTGYFTPDGPAELPAAVRLNADSTREPLPGPHPVLAHAVCAGDWDVATLRVVQSVSRTDVQPFPAPKEFMQRFRVPEAVELRWIELALAEVFTPYFVRSGDEAFDIAPPRSIIGAPVIAVIDGDAMPEPLPQVPASMVEAPFAFNALAQAAAGMAWVSHLDFDHVVTLAPDHDYWIWMREAAGTTFLNRRIHGDEPPEFTAGVGPYFARTDTAGEWIRAADQVLAFRIVARPTSIPPPPPPPPPAFALSTTPNPARGSVRVDWSGAVGRVRFEVLDVRGRRVSQGTGGAAGTWTWPGTDRDGRAVASGIYFVRARDAAGRESVERQVVMR